MLSITTAGNGGVHAGAMPEPDASEGPGRWRFSADISSMPTLLLEIPSLVSPRAARAAALGASGPGPVVGERASPE